MSWKYHLPEHFRIFTYIDGTVTITTISSLLVPSLRLRAIYFAATTVYFIRPSHDNTTIILFSQTDEVIFLLLPHRKLHRNITHELSNCCEQHGSNLCLRYFDVKK